MIGLGLGLSRVALAGVSGPPAKTYADFLSHINARSSGVDQPWDALVTIDAGTYTTQAGAVGSSTMTGSSWQTRFTSNGGLTRGVARVVQHGLPSQVVFDDQIAQARKLLIVVTAVAGDFPISLTRNGYTSSSDNINQNGDRTLTELVYWYNNAAWTTNPFAGTGPSPYTIP